MIAKKRGPDPELSSMAAMLHDLNVYKTGSYDDHAHQGAAHARQIPDELKLTDASETDMIFPRWLRKRNRKDMIGSVKSLECYFRRS